MPDSVSTLEETGPEITEITKITEITEITESDLLEDSLVEEVSIDGMCGVY